MKSKISVSLAVSSFCRVFSAGPVPSRLSSACSRVVIRVPASCSAVSPAKAA